MRAWGKVIEVTEELPKLQFLNVHLFESKKMIKAIHYKTDREICDEGTMVEVNISAIDLNLGTGGYGFVISIFQMASSEREQYWKSEQQHKYPGHIIKLRYTPVQTPVLAVESQESEYHALFQTNFDLGGKKVFVGELHSMLPILASLLHCWQPRAKIAYIMDDQASLNISLSEHVRHLKNKTDITTITIGQAIGGDIEAINIYTALEAAQKVVQADHVVITQGPGVVGTGTKRGFSGMQQVHWIHAIHSCGGEAIILPRIQFLDRRERHYGLSHHTMEALHRHTFVSTLLPFPDLSESKNMSDEMNHLLSQIDQLSQKHKVFAKVPSLYHDELNKALQWYNKPIKTMGRDFQEEPIFFYAIAAAYYLYKELV